MADVTDSHAPTRESPPVPTPAPAEDTPKQRRSVLDRLGHDALIVSDRGHRHAVVVERFGESPTVGAGAGDVLLDRR